MATKHSELEVDPRRNDLLVLVLKHLSSRNTNTYYMNTLGKDASAKLVTDALLEQTIDGHPITADDFVTAITLKDLQVFGFEVTYMAYSRKYPDQKRSSDPEYNDNVETIRDTNRILRPVFGEEYYRCSDRPLFLTIYEQLKDAEFGIPPVRLTTKEILEVAERVHSTYPTVRVADIERIGITTADLITVHTAITTDAGYEAENIHNIVRDRLANEVLEAIADDTPLMERAKREKRALAEMYRVLGKTNPKLAALATVSVMEEGLEGRRIEMLAYGHLDAAAFREYALSLERHLDDSSNPKPNFTAIYHNLEESEILARAGKVSGQSGNPKQMTLINVNRVMRCYSCPENEATAEYAIVVALKIEEQLAAARGKVNPLPVPAIDAVEAFDSREEVIAFARVHKAYMADPDNIPEPNIVGMLLKKTKREIPSELAEYNPPDAFPLDYQAEWYPMTTVDKQKIWRTPLPPLPDGADAEVFYAPLINRLKLAGITHYELRESVEMGGVLTLRVYEEGQKDKLIAIANYGPDATIPGIMNGEEYSAAIQRKLDNALSYHYTYPAHEPPAPTDWFRMKTLDGNEITRTVLKPDTDIESLVRNLIVSGIPKEAIVLKRSVEMGALTLRIYDKTEGHEGNIQKLEGAIEQRLIPGAIHSKSYTQELLEAGRVKNHLNPELRENLQRGATWEEHIAAGRRVDSPSHSPTL